MSGRPWPGGSALVLTELSLFSVHVAVVLGFARLYDEWSFAPDLLVALVVAHVLAAVCRRLVPAPVAALVAVVGLALVGTWMLFPETAIFGFPSAETWEVASTAVSDARNAFRTVVAPTEPTVGFQAITILALWASVWFADWAAFRLRATIEAVAPAAVLFVFTTILGSGAYRLVSAGAFAGAVLAFVVTHRALRARLDQAWLSDGPDHGPQALLRVGAVTAVVALVAGIVVGPNLPGSGDEALITWRNQRTDGPGDRTTVSPIVDLRRRLVNQSDEVFFTVRADRPTYWRLTALDDFDGQLWTIDKEFAVASRRLTSEPIDEDRRLRQTFDIVGMDDLWVPAAFEAKELVESSERLRWDGSTATLITDREAGGTAGMTYTVESATPTFAPEELRWAEGSQPAEISDRLQLPPSFPEEARALAAEVVSEEHSRYDQALLLQNWFRREFRYSTDIESGHSDRALMDFLEERVGYCEQFAGAYAAMARSIGIPARVAVGFTPGELDPTTGRYVVRGRHAHAWPEVWFPEAGWVPFEPTPGRGLPGAERFTGVRPAQDETPSDPTDPSTTTTAPPGGPTTTAAPAAPTTTTSRPEPTITDAGDAPPSSPTPWWTWAAALAVLALAAWPAALALVRRSRRPGDATGPAAEVLASWQGALASLRWVSGLQPDPAETHAEFARRGGEHEAEVADALRALGGLVGQAAWDPASIDDADVRRASALGEGIRSTLEARTTRRDRLRRLLSWREALA